MNKKDSGIGHNQIRKYCPKNHLFDEFLRLKMSISDRIMYIFRLELHSKILILGCYAVLNFRFLYLDKEQKVRNTDVFRTFLMQYKLKI